MTMLDSLSLQEREKEHDEAAVQSADVVVCIALYIQIIVVIYYNGMISYHICVLRNNDNRSCLPVSFVSVTSDHFCSSQFYQLQWLMAARLLCNDDNGSCLLESFVTMTCATRFGEKQIYIKTSKSTDLVWNSERLTFC